MKIRVSVVSYSFIFPHPPGDWKKKKKLTPTLVVVFTLTRIIKSVVTGQAPITLEWTNTPGKEHNQNQKKWCTLIS